MSSLTEGLDQAPDVFDVVCAEAVRAVPGATTASFTTGEISANEADCLTSPLTVGGTPGTLAVYARDGFPDDAPAALALYVAIVRFGLRARHHRDSAESLAEVSKEALKSRAVIEQAKGILMAAHRINADEAAGRLLEQSRREDVKLREVASRFVGEAT
ncbi:ANTAR domain-containing protein [Amycolatopsis sp. PS_44_ISF1]|uniref:ANTAR domain-containing protein n=1 Tax=Amycolatopsis sp. PS_44_ISF1 TaxID=2974917 RepID=UPI0028DD59CC|nr:ANTAR domain-containing protein [Amycolatopsis sp. PS_44_ISF1]MDT8911820.1 ANTAR domain-containing protein [Amycolatopsis sp. PS_44_ISF1]